jgi:CheY-like chemotaxis protein
LVVDDDPRSLKLMTIVLGNAGYRVVTASDGPAGLERLVAEQPDIVMVDLMMPGMDGLEFCSCVRALPALGDTPLVLATAIAADDVREQALNAGVDALLVKPFERPLLLGELERLLEAARANPAGSGVRPRPDR